ncbi:MAG: TonB-dependent receptor plug domain-containing protein, partial [Bacteroidota bacterium]
MGRKTYFTSWFLLLLLCLSTLGMAQELMRINNHFEQQPLEQVISWMEEEFDLAFSYDPALVKTYQINTQIANLPLEKALDQILQQTQLTYELVDQRYVILKSKEERLTLQAPDLPEVPTRLLCGRLIDQLSGEGLLYGNVAIAGTSRGTQTDEQGYFQLSIQEDQGDSLYFSYVGYTDQHWPITSFLGDQCPEVTMKIAEMGIGEVLVIDRAIDLLGTSKNDNSISLDPDYVVGLPGWGEADVLRVVQLLPGIHSTDESAAGIHIRGGTPDQNLILWDDIPIYHAGHFFGMFSAFNPNMVEKVETYRGDFGARYGGRASGIIDISSKPEEIDSLEYGIGVSLIDLQAYAKIPMANKKSALLFGIRRSYTDIIQSNTYLNIFNRVANQGKISQLEQFRDSTDALFISDPVFYFSDVNAKWVYRPNSKWNTSLSYYNGRDNLTYEFQVADVLRSFDEVDLSNVGLSNKWQYNWRPYFQSNLSLSWSHFTYNYNFEFDSEVDNQKGFRYIGSRVSDLTLSVNHEVHIGDRWGSGDSLSFFFGSQFKGLEFNYNYEYNINENQTGFQDLARRVLLFTNYHAWRWNHRNKVKTEMGWRFNLLNQLSISTLEPRLSIKFYPFELPIATKGIEFNAQTRL